MNQRLCGKRVIVTGGGTGIGRAVSQALARNGACVAVVYSQSESDAFDTVTAIKERGGQAIAIKADVSDDGEVRAMIDEVVTRLGGIDYLVNNAGITRQLEFSDLDAISDDIWDVLFAVNVRGAFNCARAALPHLKQNPDAAVLNIGSIAGETGYGSSLPYAVSKAATHGLTRSLARALAPHVRVNCIAPGAVATRWWAGNEEKMHRLSGALPLQRISTPEDIAETSVAVLTAASMTGQIIRLENGQTL